MKLFQRRRSWGGLLMGSLFCLGACQGPGGHHGHGAHVGPPPPTLGTGVDQVMRLQEENAEASKFVVYQHEFELNHHKRGRSFGGWRLNEYGEDHLKSIAQQLRQGVSWPVVIERSQTSARPNTRFRYPIHFNPDLDLKRREVVVHALAALGIPDADQRVVVAPAFAQGYEQHEAERAYLRGVSGFNGNAGGRGFGGGFGGGFF